jgi:Transposase DDE domain
MKRASLLNQDWCHVVDRLGGAKTIEASARATQAFRRARGLPGAVALLRLVLAYCLRQGGLRSTAAWASGIGLADISNVAVLNRLRGCGDWLAALVGWLLAAQAPVASRGRLVRLIDATAVPKAGAAARRGNGVWRVHSAFDLPAERFAGFVVSEEKGGERLDRIAVEPGEIRVADRAYLQPDRIAAVLAAGGDVVVRSGWRNAAWLDATGAPFDLIAALCESAEHGLIDRSIGVRRRGNAPPLRLRLVAAKKSPQAGAAARRTARREAQKGGHQISQATLVAADWLILVTSLPQAAFATADILALYRLRWRIELAFKRLKSLVGLKGPPGTDPRSARPYVLAHLLMILLLEPLSEALAVSPRPAAV